MFGTRLSELLGWLRGSSTVRQLRTGLVQPLFYIQAGVVRRVEADADLLAFLVSHNGGDFYLNFGGQRESQADRLGDGHGRVSAEQHAALADVSRLTFVTLVAGVNVHRDRKRQTGVTALLGTAVRVCAEQHVHQNRDRDGAAQNNEKHLGE